MAAMSLDTQHSLLVDCPTCRLAEIIQEKESDRAAATNLQELAAGGGKTKKAAKVGAAALHLCWVCGTDLGVHAHTGPKSDMHGVF